MNYLKNLKNRNFGRIITMVALDMLIILFSVWFTGVLRTNDLHTWDGRFIMQRYREILMLLLLTEVMLVFSKNYNISWRYAGFFEYFLLYGASGAGILAANFFTQVIIGNTSDVTFAEYVIIYLICVVGFTIERLGGAMLRIYRSRYFHGKENSSKTRVMIVGGGDTGSALIRSMRKNGGMYPVVVIDDDKNKHGMRVSEVPVAGGREVIADAVKKYRVEEIIIAIPSGKESEMLSLVQICRNTGKKTSSVPSLFELASGKANVGQVREVTPQELLGRTEELVSDKDIFGYIEGKTVLVTGGGGSIGSELCRQIARFNPGRLIVFDIYENNAYELQMELKSRMPALKLEVLIGSVRDTARLEEVFSEYKPKVVFHAAAHKHVPLMEDSPNEAIKNNVYGTYNVAKACEKFEAERFVLISTDKAVNPTNIMGASKRIAEMVMQRFSMRHAEGKSKTIYTAVRFGNVLGSNGSVIPLFKKQIKEGGPITVTHPEINRFFMTIPEAAQLVMQAGALASGGEIFILDMGEPVKIVDLARNLIELSGYTPDVDIKIEFSGLRPGEKMYEELLLDKQRHTATKHDKIFIEQPIDDDACLVAEIHSLRERLACDVPVYDSMIEWITEEFNMSR